MDKEKIAQAISKWVRVDSGDRCNSLLFKELNSNRQYLSLFRNYSSFQAFIAWVEYTNISNIVRYCRNMFKSFNCYLLEKWSTWSLILPRNQEDPRKPLVIQSLLAEIRENRLEVSNLNVMWFLYWSFMFWDPSTNPDIDFNLIAMNENDNPNNILRYILDIKLNLDWLIFFELSDTEWYI